MPRAWMWSAMPSPARAVTTIPSGVCTDGLTQAACDCPTCEWVKLGSCSDLECPHTSIPAVSEWGLVVVTLLLLTAAKIAFRRSEVCFFSRS